MKKAVHSYKRLDSFLTAVFILEMAVFFCRLPLKEKLSFRVVNSQQEYKAEWVLPSGTGENITGDVYGIRICPDTWELQFYHSQDIFCPEESFGDGPDAYSKAPKEKGFAPEF
ncbi:MAG: hypothetical protein HFG57_11700 [Lachnospiraceae bacterium]|jgi:hypothetical protein|nr:hypothetical protein [Lachnospiraceae bacterium]MCI9106588.1 hypothetical protein [Lachnospiraceae bacterium]